MPQEQDHLVIDYTEERTYEEFSNTEDGDYERVNQVLAGERTATLVEPVAEGDEDDTETDEDLPTGTAAQGSKDYASDNGAASSGDDTDTDGDAY
ncbi:hypothetical protein BGZ65_006511 [Modicella reniformis]|uniref:Uncharacterized protein n=1 Tax=Modicella reniformis TaxID=1440133 RepID=A0A9P6JHD1_9FUNG|nr:hypothetical protein BGZ65_006511 [Modicella reniformis]